MGRSALHKRRGLRHDRYMGSPAEVQRPVVVGADGSASAERALRWAAREAARRHAPLRIVNAWHEPSATMPGPMGGPHVDPEELRGGSLHLLERARSTVQRVVGEDLEITLQPVVGHAAEALVAASKDAGLLVVGQRGRGAVVGAVLGSVAASCARHSTVPVAIIGLEGPEGPPARLVVGLDTSEGSRRALRWALQESVLSGASVHAVHGWQISEPAPDDAGLLDGPVFTGPTRSLLESIVADESRDRPASLAPVTLDAQSSNPGELLVDRAVGADLLVVGAREHRGLVQLLVGSVSQHCLHHSPCPLVIVPGPHR